VELYYAFKMPTDRKFIALTIGTALSALLLGAAASPVATLRPTDETSKYYLEFEPRPEAAAPLNGPDKAERKAIAKWPKLVRRAGATLFVRLANGEEAALKSAGECDGFDQCAIFTFAEYLPSADRFLVQAEQGEGEDLLVVDRKSGKVAATYSEPHLSPDGRLIVALQDYSEGVLGKDAVLNELLPSGGLKRLWRSSEGEPDGKEAYDKFEYVAWRGAATIEFTRRRPAKYPKYGKAQHLWLVEEGGHWKLTTSAR
jgi:hypothetical protein